METQTEFRDIEPSFNPNNFSPITTVRLITEAAPTFKDVNKEEAALTFKNVNKELLRIEKDGTVIAPDLESASEAGRIFVQMIREQLKIKL
jgi:hypothetical protein